MNRLSIPDQKNYDYTYGQAYQLAVNELVSSADLQVKCAKSGFNYYQQGNDRFIKVVYLDCDYIIDLPKIDIRRLNSDEPVELRDKILILHYLNQAKGTEPSGKMISFKELSEVASYYPTFRKRAIQPLIDQFGNRPNEIVNIAGAIGGAKSDSGDASVIIKAFNRVPITLVIWGGDEEFPSDANILFDANIKDYLSLEDIIILCQTISWRLVKLSQH